MLESCLNFLNYSTLTQHSLFVFQAGLEAASAEKKHEHELEEKKRKDVIQGPTVHDAARSGNLERMQELISFYPEMRE